MPRKKEAASTTEKEIFPSRLRQLMKDQDTTQAKLAEAISMRPQTVSLYAAGQSYPDVNTLRKIAEFFHVTADYLLGLSDAAAPDPSIQSACYTLGLSEKAAGKLMDWHQTPRVESDPGTRWLGEHMVSRMVESSHFDTMINKMTAYILYSGILRPDKARPAAEKPSPDEFCRMNRWMDSQNLKMMDTAAVRDMYLQAASDELKAIMQEFVEKEG